MLSTVGPTDAVQEDILCTAFGPGAATAQTDAFETTRAARWAVAIGDALSDRSCRRLAEAASANIARTGVSRASPMHLELRDAV